MLDILWNTRGYFFWLLMVSVLCFALERFRPWRKTQPLLRQELGQDLIWLVINGHYVGIVLSFLTVWLIAELAPASVANSLAYVESFNLLAAWPLVAQILVFFVLKDFLEWSVHNLLHRNKYLWELHKLHHSITEMDWIGNFRFHWGEVVVYQTLTYLPLVLLGVDGRVILWVAIFGTLIGHLNHSNLNLTWGPLRYLFNSPRMHIWHHDKHLTPEHPKGVNFGICLSLWDWMFRTAHWPDPHEAPTQQPEALGFHDLDQYPKGFLGRLFYPLTKR